MQSYTDPCTYALQYDAFLLELMNDAPGEIYDVDEEEKFNVESYINGDTDFWFSIYIFYWESEPPVDSWLKCHKGACNPPRSVQIYHHEQNTDDSDTPRTSGFHVRYNASR